VSDDTDVSIGVALGAGEIATFIPIRGGFITWASEYLDPAAGCAIGWNYLYAATMFACADIVAVAGLFGYWWPEVNPAAWISLSLGVITALNCFHVRFYGESEFWFASLKVRLSVIWRPRLMPHRSC
jgi:amino acid permease